MYKVIAFFCFLLAVNISNSQRVVDLVDKADPNLREIDTLFAAKKYDVALFKLNEIETRIKYKKISDYLWINFKKAEVFRIVGKNERSISLLNAGLDRIGYNDSFKGTKIDYYQSLSYNYSDLEKYNEAREYAKKAIKISKTIEDNYRITFLYRNIGGLFFKEKKLDSAQYYYREAVRYKMTNENKSNIAEAYNQLGIVSYYYLGDAFKAKSYFEKALNIKEDTGDKLGIVRLLMNISGMDYSEGKYEKSREQYADAYKLLANEKSKASLKNKALILENLSNTGVALGDFEYAYEYMYKAFKVKDSFLAAEEDSDRFLRIARDNIEFSSEEALSAKSRELNTQVLFYSTVFALIALIVFGYIFYRNYRLREQNKIDSINSDLQNKVINATIDGRENERRAIAQTLHDSVSALLSSANLHLQATKAQLKENSPQEITKAQKILNEASVKIRDLSHELISSVLMKFGLAFAVHDLCQKYSNYKITFHSDDDGIKRYHEDFEIKIYNIIEELLNNILKHSKASNATIMMAHRDNNMLSVRISDDGVGFDTKNTGNSDGLGLTHIDSRVKMMKGVFNIVSAPNNGTNIFILLPIKAKQV